MMRPPHGLASPPAAPDAHARPLACPLEQARTSVSWLEDGGEAGLARAAGRDRGDAPKSTGWASRLGVVMRLKRGVARRRDQGLQVTENNRK
jgi:hypothetical protein